MTVITTLVYANSSRVDTCFCPRRFRTPRNIRVNDNYILRKKGIIHIKNQFLELVKRFNSIGFYENTASKNKIEIGTDIISENIFPVNSDNNEKYIHEINISIRGIIIKISIRAITKSASILGGFWRITYEQISNSEQNKHTPHYEKSYSRYYRNQFEVDLCRGFFIIINKVLKNDLSNFDLMDQTNQKITSNLASFHTQRCIIDKSRIRYSSITEFSLNGGVYGSKRKSKIKNLKNPKNQKKIKMNNFPKKVLLFKNRDNKEIVKNFLSKKNMKTKLKLLDKDLKNKYQKIEELKTTIALKNKNSSEEESYISNEEQIFSSNNQPEISMRNTELKSEVLRKSGDQTELEPRLREALFLKDDKLKERDTQSRSPLPLKLKDDQLLLTKSDLTEENRLRNLKDSLKTRLINLKSNGTKIQGKKFKGSSLTNNQQSFNNIKGQKLSDIVQRQKLQANRNDQINLGIKIDNKALNKNQIPLVINRNKIPLNKNNQKNLKKNSYNPKPRNDNGLIIGGQGLKINNNFQNLKKVDQKLLIKNKNKLTSKKEIIDQKINNNLQNLKKVDQNLLIKNNKLTPKKEITDQKKNETVQKNISKNLKKENLSLSYEKNKVLPLKEVEISDEKLLVKLRKGVKEEIKNNLNINKRKNTNMNFNNGLYDKSFKNEDKLIKLESMNDLEDMMDESDNSEEVNFALRTKLNFENNVGIGLTHILEDNFWIPPETLMMEKSEEDLHMTREDILMEESEEENLQIITALNQYDIKKEVNKTLIQKSEVKKVTTDSEEDSTDLESEEEITLENNINKKKKKKINR